MIIVPLSNQSSLATFFRGIISLGVDFMATSKEFRDYILDQLNILTDITYKPMMGEYLLYYKGTLFGGIYDNRLLIKIVNNNKKYNMQEAIPYDKAKPMYLVSEIDNCEVLKEIILDTYDGLIK